MKIYIVNGAPGSGKTTFETMVQEILSNRVHILSTVTIIKDMLIEYDIWDCNKDLKSRKLISDIKDTLTEYNDYPFKYISSVIEKIQLTETQNNPVIFIDCREPDEIQKFCDIWNAKSVLIRRETAENTQTSNHADQEVLKYDYDIVINNNGTMKNLQKEINSFIIKEKLKGE